MSLIKVEGLTFGYEGSYDKIFDGASFQLDTGWKLGLTGRNGRGKTTFLRLLMGQYGYSGKIITEKNLTFQYFPYDVKNPELTVTEAIEEVMAGDYEEWRMLLEMNRLGVKAAVLRQPFKTLSSGERTKLLLAALFIKENPFLLIDEPTNHLDRGGREQVAEYLNSKKGFILVSHDRDFLDGCIDHVLSINRANIEVCQGNFSSWMENKRLEDEYEIEQNLKLKKEIKRLTETAREKAKWSDKIEATKIGNHVADRGRIGHLAAKMMKRSKAIEGRQERAIEEKSRLMKNLELVGDLKLQPLTHHAKSLAELENVSLFYGQRCVVEGLSFSLEPGERIALVGVNGSGKSSIVKLLCGQEISHTGKLRVASGLIISYVSQETDHLFGTLEDYADSFNIDKALFMTILRKLDFPRVQFDKNMEDYSGGQKKKVLIARSLCEKAHLYIWDEPLNFIDVISRMQIESLLKTFRPTMVFIEHDRAFCTSIATRTVNLK